jgi:hypothetical protein
MRREILSVGVLLLLSVGGQAQTPAALIGTWQRVAEPPAPTTVLFLSTDGYYAQMAIPAKRPIPKNDFDHMTREELMKQYGGVRAAYGSYTVSGNKITLRRIAAISPANEGTDVVWEFRIEAGALVVTVPGGKGESRFRPIAVK